MNFKWDLKRPTLPKGIYYGYKSNRIMYPYFPFIELTEEKRNEDYILIPYYEDDYLEVKDFQNFLEEDIYLNNDFISYENGVFSNGFNKFGNGETTLVEEDTGCALLVEDSVNQRLASLTEVNYFDFCDLVKKVKEFDGEDPKNELRTVTGLGGKFMKLEDKGIVCLERISKKYIFLSYLAIFEEYRKQGQLERLLGAIKLMYPDQKLVLAVIEPKVKEKYLGLGFKQVGYLKNFA